MNIKKFVLGITSVILSSFVFSQTDSTDLHLSISDPIYQNDQDSLFYPKDIYSGLELKFKLTDQEALGKLHLEVFTGENKIAFIKKIYTLNDLKNLGLKPNGQIKLSLGNVMKDENFGVLIVIENKEGLKGSAIEKHI